MFMHIDGVADLHGVADHFAEGWWGVKTVSMLKMGHENFSNWAKLSSALVSRIKSDRSLKTGLEPRKSVRVNLIVKYTDRTNSENGRLSRDGNSIPNQTQNSSKQQLSDSSWQIRSFQMKNTKTSLMLGNKE